LSEKVTIVFKPWSAPTVLPLVFLSLSISYLISTELGENKKELSRIPCLLHLLCCLWNLTGNLIDLLLVLIKLFNLIKASKLLFVSLKSTQTLLSSGFRLSKLGFPGLFLIAFLKFLDIFLDLLLSLLIINWRFFCFSIFPLTID